MRMNLIIISTERSRVLKMKSAAFYTIKQDSRMLREKQFDYSVSNGYNPYKTNYR